MRGIGLQLLRSLFAKRAAPWDIICLVGMGYAFGDGTNVAGGLALLIWFGGALLADAILARADRRPSGILPLDSTRKDRR